MLRIHKLAGCFPLWIDIFRTVVVVMFSSHSSSNEGEESGNDAMVVVFSSYSSSDEEEESGHDDSSVLLALGDIDVSDDFDDDGVEAPDHLMTFSTYTPATAELRTLPAIASRPIHIF